MKILRSKGTSFTDLNERGEEGRTTELARGLYPKADRTLTAGDFAQDDVVVPSRLADYVGKDHALALRQTISALDKVIRKPRSLSDFEIQAYIDRTRLSVELWQRLCFRHKAAILALDDDGKAFEQFEQAWLWKVHPYAVAPFDPTAPNTDKNAALIQTNADAQKERSVFNGRWHRALWKTKNDNPDYAATADAIFRHLWEQERDVRGWIRRDGGQVSPATGQGLVAARGLSMASSANDPRVGRNPLKIPNWNADDEVLYFDPDVARTIFDEVIAGKGRHRFPAWQFGKILYEHFPVVAGSFSDDKEAKQRLWSLHNWVRRYYQKLGKSERFRRACTSGNDSELRKIVPADGHHLLGILRAKSRNADFGELIRLGKLIVHAADLPADTQDIASAFVQRMDYYATSAGQAEIKRNEAFTRVWRNSVGLSLRTLKAWADPDGKAKVALRRSGQLGDQEIDDDLASPGVALAAVNGLQPGHFERHTRLVFGDKSVPGTGPGSRASIFLPESDDEKKELLWAMLRLAGEVRNRTNHFNTMQRLVGVLQNGVLSEQERVVSGIGGAELHTAEQMPTDKAASCAMATFKALLDFDLSMQAQAIVDDLKQFDVPRLVPLERREALLAELSPIQASSAVTAPRFLAVMQHVKNLAGHDPGLLHDMLKPFIALDLDPGPAATRGVNHCRLGALRLLYASGFQGWMAELGSGSGIVAAAVATAIQAKKTRTAQFEEEAGQFYRSVGTLAEDLALDTLDDLDSLLKALASQSAGAERIRQTYRPDPGEQKKRSSWVDQFRREVFAYLFGAYLQDRGLTWIWEIEDRGDSGPTPPPILPDDIRVPEWHPQPWHCQFYAWLYLVPSDDASLLRHQLRKTAVLEGKGHTESRTQRVSQAIDDCDRLMGLYTRVQSAGFSGAEHAGDHALKTVLYEDPAKFDIIFCRDNETYHASFPGTQRGLRQMLRFGHYDALKRVFEKHKITNADVDEFTKLTSSDAQQSAEIKHVFARRAELRSLIDVLAKSRGEDAQSLVEACAEYKTTAAQTALHTFRANAARLTEHARLHQLLMRVVGRLMDFTMMWERDATYIFLGMLYRQAEHKGGMAIVAKRPEGERSSGRIELELPPGSAPSREGDPLRNKDLRIRLWSDARGFTTPRFMNLIGLLNDENRRLFERHYFQLHSENPKDVAARERRIAAGSDEDLRFNWKDGKWAIRNDFAHYNVVGTKKGPINLTYLTNAVRSLLSYDRKLKNAVSKAIKEIVADDGLILEWELHEDRLRRPRVRPDVEEHLKMVGGPEAQQVRFPLPRRSVRYTSMVKALFDFDNGGYRKLLGPATKKKRRGFLEYPDEFLRKFEDRVPSLMLVRYPELPPE